MKTKGTSTLLGSVILALSTLPAHAGQIGYKVWENGTLVINTVATVSSTPPYSNRTINIGTRNGNVGIHIFDVTTNGDAVDSVGLITIRGTQNCEGCPVVLAIADAGLSSADAAFTVPPETQISAGLRHLGGLEFLPLPTDPNNTNMARQSVVSVSVLGDITGNVTAGTLYRVEALRTQTEPFLGGTISGTLLATRGDGKVLGYILGTGGLAVGAVRAEWQITGNIEASGERDASNVPLFTTQDDTTWGSIGGIRIGPSPDAPGLRGNVDAAYGFIEQIISTGQIGDGPELANRSSITAGIRLGHMTTRVTAIVDNQPVVLSRPIYADIEAYARNISRSAMASLLNREGDCAVMSPGPSPAPSTVNWKFPVLR
jgi:hypothetical protein